MDPSVRIACLFSGDGGLSRAVGLVVPWARVVVYVEREVYPAAVLLARMEDSSMDPAPLWCGDVVEVDWRSWRGAVDLVVAGFPCQPFSLAGSRKGLEDERWLWPEVARAVREVEPGYVFLENVAGLLAGSGGFDAVLSDLAALGFHAEWLVLRASEVGAPHERARVFVLAYRDGVGFDGLGLGRLLDGERETSRDDAHGCDSSMADSDGERRNGLHERQRTRRLETDVGQRRDRCGAESFWPPGSDDADGWRRWLVRQPGTEPAIRRGVDGSSAGLDVAARRERTERLRALGNGVVEIQGAYAFVELAWRATRR